MKGKEGMIREKERRIYSITGAETAQNRYSTCVLSCNLHTHIVVQYLYPTLDSAKREKHKKKEATHRV